MSETDGDLPDLEEPGTDLALDVVEGEIVDEEDPYGAPEDFIDAEIERDTGAELELRGTHVYAGWGQPEQVPTGPTGKHVDRDFIPEHGINGGGGAGASRTRSRNPFKRRKNSGGGGSGNGGGNNYSLIGGLFNNSALVKTGAVASNNSVIRGGPVASGNNGLTLGGRPKATQHRPTAKGWFD